MSHLISHAQMPPGERTPTKKEALLTALRKYRPDAEAIQIVEVLDRKNGISDLKLNRIARIEAELPEIAREMVGETTPLMYSGEASFSRWVDDRKALVAEAKGNVTRISQAVGEEVPLPQDVTGLRRLNAVVAGLQRRFDGQYLDVLALAVKKHGAGIVIEHNAERVLEKCATVAKTRERVEERGDEIEELKQTLYSAFPSIPASRIDEAVANNIVQNKRIRIANVLDRIAQIDSEGLKEHVARRFASLFDQERGYKRALESMIADRNKVQKDNELRTLLEEVVGSERTERFVSAIKGKGVLACRILDRIAQLRGEFGRPTADEFLRHGTEVIRSSKKGWNEWLKAKRKEVATQEARTDLKSQINAELVKLCGPERAASAIEKMILAPATVLNRIEAVKAEFGEDDCIEFMRVAGPTAVTSSSSKSFSASVDSFREEREGRATLARLLPPEEMEHVLEIKKRKRASFRKLADKAAELRKIGRPSAAALFSTGEQFEVYKRNLKKKTALSRFRKTILGFLIPALSREDADRRVNSVQECHRVGRVMNRLNSLLMERGPEIVEWIVTKQWSAVAATRDDEWECEKRTLIEGYIRNKPRRTVLELRELYGVEFPISFGDREIFEIHGEIMDGYPTVMIRVNNNSGFRLYGFEAEEVLRTAAAIVSNDRARITDEIERVILEMRWIRERYKNNWYLGDRSHHIVRYFMLRMKAINMYDPTLELVELLSNDKVRGGQYMLHNYANFMQRYFPELYSGETTEELELYAKDVGDRKGFVYPDTLDED